MKVLVVHTYYKQRGGEDSVVENEIELLKSNNITVELLSFFNQGNTFLKFLQSPFNYQSYNITLKKLNEFKPDIVHIHNLHFSGSVAVLYAIKKLKIPIVITLHNYRLVCPSGSLFYKGKPFYNSLNGGFPWAATKMGVYQDSKFKTFWLSLTIYLQQKLGILNDVDKFILLGKHSKEIFLKSPLKHLTDRMIIKPNFSPISATDVSFPKTSSFLFIGRLTEEKGINVLLKAFKGSDHKIKIVGTGPLESLVQEYSASNLNIEFLGEQNREEVNHLLEKCTALIFPSIWFETFGMVIIEAFAKGKPVIASNLGNISNLIKDGYNGYLFEPGSENDLYEKIISYINLDENTKTLLSFNAKKSHLDLYSPQVNITQLLKIYQEAITTKLNLL
ncbi:glycosyltransferase [Pedobacter mucosus]|uniref:glycosyltransferase n=1 Tax=Pedobacter mucosus TaxID=2895286 RepID=UPI001EE481CC|nr:glycosyltransferase [Pedobacter mucosus]UKT62404.1 glycosyltransferase [Pedobacter mucosus]